MQRDDSPDGARLRAGAPSPGHNPPRILDRALPTLRPGINGDGSPAKTAPRTQGTNPWILGSMTIGSQHIYALDWYKFETSSPNVWFKLRHNHAGNLAGSTPSNQPGGTLMTWHLAARGARENHAGRDAAFIAVPAGTVFLYGFGAGSVSGTSSNLVHRALGTRGVDRFSGHVRGQLFG